MKRKQLTALITSVLFFQICPAQNLVLNPGFEDSLQCPSGSGAFTNYVAIWTKPSYGSADYFYTGCPVAPSVEPPHGGNAYAGIICYDPANYREYMTGTLASPLLPGSTYDVSFFVSLMDNCIDGISEVGAWFTPNNISYPNTLPIILTPQIENTVPLTVDSGWKKVSGTFQAMGGEQYIIIGSFRPDSQLTFTPAPGINSWFDVYYFIDDVSVIRDSTVGMNTREKNIFDLAVFPNPFTDYITLQWNNAKANISEAEIKILDVTGRKSFQSEKLTVTDKSYEIAFDLKHLSPGIYFLSASTKEKIFNRKIVKE
ncbi:MAG: T9SS type A sorting domain-containing protein [Bacteroidia bacterium]